MSLRQSPFWSRSIDEPRGVHGGGIQTLWAAIRYKMASGVTRRAGKMALYLRKANRNAKQENKKGQRGRQEYAKG